MPSKRNPAGPRALLEELELRARSDAEVRGELERAVESFPSFRRGEPGWAARFREWFLLERTAECLGLPPAVAWAPDFVDPGSPWDRLLENFLGVFQAARAPQEGTLLLEDLWSRRLIPLRLAGMEELTVPGTLGFGRVHPAGDGGFLPLPGFETHWIPDFGDALRRDLARIRAANPRRRLSQLELERLLAPFLAGAASTKREGIETRLGQLLRDVPGWSLDETRRQVREKGVHEVLDQIAFETRLDLEPFRVLLPAWERELAREASRTAEPREEAVPRNPRVGVDEALRTFDRGRRSGVPLEGLFATLEEDLGLEPGTTLISGEATLPEPSAASAPPFETWLLSYSWERRAEGTPLSAPEETVLKAFGRFLTAQKNRMEIKDLSPGLVLAFLLSAEDPDGLDRYRRNLEGFLSWVVREQEAPLGDLTEDLAGSFGERLRRVVQCNRELAETTTPPKSKARVFTTRPLQVLDEEGNPSPAEGLPPAFESLPQHKDLFLGSWKGGIFRVSRLIPAEVLAF